MCVCIYLYMCVRVLACVWLHVCVGYAWYRGSVNASHPATPDSNLLKSLKYFLVKFGAQRSKEQICCLKKRMAPNLIQRGLLELRQCDRRAQTRQSTGH